MIVDPAGRPAGESDIQWMVPMLFSWLADERVRAAVVGRRLYTLQNVKILGGLLHAAHRDSMPFPEENLQKHALKILSDRVVRISIARKWYVDQLNIHVAWEERCVRYPDIEQAWAHALATGRATAADRPEDPRMHPPQPRLTRFQARKELQDTRLALEQRVENMSSLIIRPS